MPEKTLKKYRITSGSFRVSDDQVLATGETIELEDDVAERFAHQLELLPAPAEPAPKSRGRQSSSAE